MQAASGEGEADGQLYLDVQRHAAAVQLHNRSLAIAQLRALLAMPRGASVAVQDRQQRPHIKHEQEPAAAAQQTQPRLSVSKPAIAVTISSTAADLQLAAAPQQQQQQVAAGKHVVLKPRPLVHRLPDAAAVARFRSDELPEEASPEEGEQWTGQALAGGRVAAASGISSLAPRIVGDPALMGHQLAGWVKVAGAGGDAGAAEGDDAEELLGPGMGAADEQDLMDEEEWI